MFEFFSENRSAVNIRFDFCKDRLSVSKFVSSPTEGIITVGLGEKDAFGHIICKEAFAKAALAAQDLGLQECVLNIDFLVDALGLDGLYDMAEGWLGASYSFAKYKNGGSRKPVTAFIAASHRDAAFIDALNSAIALAEQMLFARTLVNEPSNKLTPEVFADTWRNAADMLPIDIDVLSADRLEALGMGAFLGIGRSSANPPRLIVMRYTGAPKTDERLGIIGKGVTVDSGGYCLKSASSMAGIKGDMAGAAAAGCALIALAKNRVKANVTVVIPACENRISSGSLLPGDVITAMDGTTIEVANTDAEGRLILADAITYSITEERVTRIVDLATLTGAVCSTLGFCCAGTLSNNDAFYAEFERAASTAGELYHRFPTFHEYEKLIESGVADIKNSSSGCGTIAAGLFVRRFARDLPWIHMDIAGTAWVDTPVWAFQTAGATGASVSTLYTLAKNTFEEVIDV